MNIDLKKTISVSSTKVKVRVILKVKLNRFFYVFNWIRDEHRYEKKNSVSLTNVMVKVIPKVKLNITIVEPWKNYVCTCVNFYQNGFITFHNKKLFKFHLKSLMLAFFAFFSMGKNSHFPLFKFHLKSFMLAFFAFFSMGKSHTSCIHVYMNVYSASEHWPSHINGDINLLPPPFFKFFKGLSVEISLFLEKKNLWSLPFDM